MIKLLIDIQDTGISYQLPSQLLQYQLSSSVPLFSRQNRLNRLCSLILECDSSEYLTQLLEVLFRDHKCAHRISLQMRRIWLSFKRQSICIWRQSLWCYIPQMLTVQLFPRGRSIWKAQRVAWLLDVVQIPQITGDSVLLQQTRAPCIVSFIGI
ncbi:hypothetical protein SS50377_25218 [Spironucleus salmonicida]|uniref:Uncharacterized protein n=1 Tax=Spironucleus salmonicida TaxID=348837 RepID=A0A9P8LRP2_9EUKA|nr:hypothetical protein SS50377_25218 [Spironucleus salmonicida]